MLLLPRIRVAEIEGEILRWVLHKEKTQENALVQMGMDKRFVLLQYPKQAAYATREYGEGTVSRLPAS
jgi:hypothetical protein